MLGPDLVGELQTASQCGWMLLSENLSVKWSGVALGWPLSNSGRIYNYYNIMTEGTCFLLCRNPGRKKNPYQNILHSYWSILRTQLDQSGNQSKWVDVDSFPNGHPTDSAAPGDSGNRNTHRGGLSRASASCHLRCSLFLTCTFHLETR